MIINNCFNATRTVIPTGREIEMREFSGHTNPETREHFQSFEEAVAFCERHPEFLPVDRDRWTWPQYAIVEKPKVGELCSKAFNGDSYPAGHIASISKTLKKITTTTGLSFYRNGHGEGWRQGGTWWLVRGHHSERNPSF